MYSLDMDNFAGAHCFERQTIIESGTCNGLLEAFPIMGRELFTVSMVSCAGRIDILQPDNKNIKDDIVIILCFMFDTILYLIIL